MNLTTIISQIDAQIAQLQQAKALLTDSSAPKKVGRPAKAISLVASHGVKKTRKPLSAEGKARIAAAQKKRWAKAKKAAVVKKAVPVVGKKTAPAPAKKTPAKQAAASAKAVPVKTS